MMNSCTECRIVDDSGLIAILRNRCEYTQQPKFGNEQWQAVLQRYAEPEPAKPQPKTLWAKLGLVTGYNFRDIAYFARDEGFSRSPDALMPIQKVWLRNIVLCNWAVREGHFQGWAEADRAFGPLWGTVEEGELIDAWIGYCKEKNHEKIRTDHNSNHISSYRSA